MLDIAYLLSVCIFPSGFSAKKLIQGHQLVNPGIQVYLKLKKNEAFKPDGSVY